MFRIIIPVYNAEKYLTETIESVIHQTLSFKENICIHLIDDASSDNSLKICNEYKKKYPKNIIVTHFKENKGVSEARNYGIKKCKYKKNVIMGFLDSDDYLDTEALEKVQDYFLRHDDIHIAASRILLKGRQEGEHKSNWRFEEREVVNIMDDYQFPQYYIGGVFLRKQAKRAVKFDRELSFWEDALALNQAIIKEGKYGLIKDAVYYYRKADDESSLVDTSWRKKERYSDFLEKGYIRLMSYSRKVKGEVIPYVQFVVANHLRLYFFPSHREAVLNTLDAHELKAFKEGLTTVLKDISEEIISEVDTSAYIKEAMFSFKEGKRIHSQCSAVDNDVQIKYKDFVLGCISERTVKILGRTRKEGYEGWIRGRFATPLYAMKEEDYIFAERGGERIIAQRYPCKIKKYILDKVYRNYKNAGFVINLPYSWKEARWGIHIDDTDVMLNEFTTEDILWME